MSEERRGHNFVVTADWTDVSANDYDCVLPRRPGAGAAGHPQQGGWRSSRSSHTRTMWWAASTRATCSAAPRRAHGCSKCASGVPQFGAVADGKLVTTACWPAGHSSFAVVSGYNIAEYIILCNSGSVFTTHGSGKFWNDVLHRNGEWNRPALLTRSCNFHGFLAYFTRANLW